MNKQGWVLMLAVALLGGVAGPGHAANTRAEVRKQVEASMLVRGTIDIEPDGRVAAYQLDQTEALTPAMFDAIDPVIRAWRFDPLVVDGKAVPVRSPMGLRLVAGQDGDNYRLRIAGVNFGRIDDEPSFARGELVPPRYPKAVAFDNVAGTVYLVLRVGREGQVEDVIAEQVNLRAIGTKPEMERYRATLADVAMKTARNRWQFNFPTEGEDADKPFISLRVPVEFILPDMPPEKTGEWIAYVPGPRQAIPWRTWDTNFQAPDAIAAGGVYPDRPIGPRLVSGLDG